MGSVETLIFGGLVLLLAGAIKGFVGLGLPTVAMALLALRLDPRAAMSLVLLPMLLSNLWQMTRGPHLGDILKRYWRFGLVLGLCVAGTVWASQSVSDRWLRLCLGVAVLAFSILSARQLVPEFPDGMKSSREMFFAAFTGIVGGLTAAWAVPLVMYLSAKRISPQEFVQTLGFLISVGSVPLLITYLLAGHTGASELALSAALVVPTLVGFTLGEILRARVDPGIFKTVLLIVFAFLGAGLILGALTATGQ